MTGPTTDATGDDRPSVGAIVLAGGRGSRLGGVDKAGLVVAGSSLLDTALTATEGCVPRVVVGPADLPVPDDVLRTREDPVFSGPASAVAAGMAAVAATGTDPDWVVLLACDVPGVGEAVPRLMDAARSVDASVDVVFAAAGDGRVDDRVEWLVSIVRTAALTRVIDALGPGGTVDRSMRRLLGGLARSFVSVPAGATDDIDTPADLERHAGPGAADTRTVTPDPALPTITPADRSGDGPVASPTGPHTAPRTGGDGPVKG